MDFLEKMLFNNSFSDLNTENNMIKFKYKDEAFSIQDKKLVPFNSQLAEILNIKQEKEIITVEKKIEIEDNPFRDIIKNGKPLSWTGSAGVSKFISCPRLAFLSSKRQRKIFSDNSIAAMEIGTFIHEYVLRHKFLLSDARDVLSLFLNSHLRMYQQHTGIDVIDIIYKTRKILFDTFLKELGEGYTARFEEMNMAKYNELNFIQYVDAYAFKRDGNKLYVTIIDLKTSSRAEVKEMTYWGQLLYYRYNLKKKLAKEFDIKEENIIFGTFILWAFYKKAKKFSYQIKEFKESVPPFTSLPMNTATIPLNILFENSKFFLPLININYLDEKPVKAYSIIMEKGKDPTKIELTEVYLSKEHEEYLENDINKACDTIFAGDIEPNYHSCNKSAWGCDYEAICHYKTKRLKNQYMSKEHMIKTVYENLNEEIVRKIIPLW